MKAKYGNISHYCFPKLISFSKIKKQQTPYILDDMYRVNDFSSYDNMSYVNIKAKIKTLRS